ncbi:MAG: hypothetical protein CW691_08850 [Candidatus Bathyarchaeum sp.]|nr:MAG: hypothetical protein CW691_08850 [Candidatus Bathyarchaeum sp.]
MSQSQLPRITQKDLMDAEDLDFTEETEHWNSYKLSDGTTLRIKLVLKEVKRLNKWKTDGSPIYMISSQNIVRTVGIPKELKKKPEIRAFKPV